MYRKQKRSPYKNLQHPGANDTLEIFFDGGYRIMTGEAASAAILMSRRGVPLQTVSRSLKNADSFSAEVHGLILAIQMAKSLSAKYVTFKGDNRALCYLVRAKQPPRSKRARAIFKQIRAEMEGIERWKIEWIPREKNRLADQKCDKEIKYYGKNGIVDLAAITQNEGGPNVNEGIIGKFLIFCSDKIKDFLWKIICRLEEGKV
jgi:ribonuclease HI